jgi:hypothetical protein
VRLSVRGEGLGEVAHPNKLKLLLYFHGQNLAFAVNKEAKEETASS